MSCSRMSTTWHRRRRPSSPRNGSPRAPAYTSAWALAGAPPWPPAACGRAPGCVRSLSTCTPL
eukprot:444141-Lingulodinium_polyedra.AAC.1